MRKGEGGAEGKLKDYETFHWPGPYYILEMGLNQEVIYEVATGKRTDHR